MSNKLANNLRKIRKENNLSQEQLAYELGVSRQAISKWESGNAYPEMEKIIQICDRFKVNIDDLLNNDISQVKEEEIAKSNLNKYIDDFLNFITDTINLFCNMSFKTKIKCLFEQFLIAIVLAIIFFFLGGFIIMILGGFLNRILPVSLYYILYDFVQSIYFVLAFIIAIIIIVHIFKVRYLNYYSKLKVEVETFDNSSTNSEKTVLNENIDKQNKILFKKNESKIIIRDDKHSDYHFLKILATLVIIMIKALALLFTSSLLFILICLIMMSIMALTIMKSGVFFVGILLGLLSAIIFILNIIIWLLNFVCNHKTDKRKLVYTFITSTIIFGISCGIIFIGTLNFNVSKVAISRNLKQDVLTLPMEDNLFFDTHINIEYIESENTDIKMEYTINKECDLAYDLTSFEGFKRVNFWGYCANPMALVRQVIDNLNNKVIADINNDIYDVKIYTSKENISKLKQNSEAYDTKLNMLNDSITYYRSKIEEYEEKFWEYEEKIRDYEQEISDLKLQIENQNYE